MPKIIGTTGPTVFNEEIKSLVQDYYKAVPLYINQDTPEGLSWVADTIDGLILAGGNDLHPLSYNEEVRNNNSLSKFDLPRDKRELQLIKVCLEKEIPILGICRGHQILGVHNKLQFLQDINNSDVCHSPSADKIELNGEVAHKIYLTQFFPQLDVDNMCSEMEYVNSFHHQAIYFNPKYLNFYLNNEILVLGTSVLRYKTKNYEAQEIIELMKGKNKKWISCQFHPEDDYESNKVSKIVVDAFKEWIE